MNKLILNHHVSISSGGIRSGMTKMSFAAMETPGSVFDNIADKLYNSNTIKQQAISDINAIYAFVIPSEGGGAFPGDADEVGGEWYVEAKEHGQAGKGRAPEGKKPDVTFELDATDFQKIVENPPEAQKLVSAGKIKVSGDQALVAKLDKVLGLGNQ